MLGTFDGDEPRCKVDPDLRAGQAGLESFGDRARAMSTGHVLDPEDEGFRKFVDPGAWGLGGYVARDHRMSPVVSCFIWLQLTVAGRRGGQLQFRIVQRA
jgi:hypothetical protein